MAVEFANRKEDIRQISEFFKKSMPQVINTVSILYIIYIYTIKKKRE